MLSLAMFVVKVLIQELVSNFDVRNLHKFRAANPVKPKIGRIAGSKIGRNSKHFHDMQRHTNNNFLTILA